MKNLLYVISLIYRKLRKCLELMANTSCPPEKQVLTVVLGNCKKSAVNYSIEKPILHNFVSLTTIYCPRLQVELNYSISSFYETQQYYNASLCVSNTSSFRVLLTSLCQWVLFLKPFFSPEKHCIILNTKNKLISK